MRKIAIIGYGFVGKAMVEFLKNHYKTEIYDPAYPEYGDKAKTSECDLAIICVPSGMKLGGECDISIVEETVKWLDVPLILIKSTIPPGTTEYLIEKYKKRICFSPEYLGEGKYFIPFWKYPHPKELKYSDFMIVGGNRKDCSDVLFYFKPIMGPNAKYHITDSNTAELTKYMENCWGAMKVTFCNEFYEIAQKFNVNYDELRELWLLDKRVERMHTLVFKEKRGFGGKCFPKDVNAIVKASTVVGYKPMLLKQILLSNNEFVHQYKDKK